MLLNRKVTSLFALIVCPLMFQLRQLKCKHPQRLSPRKIELAICAIFRDEAPFLKEWVEYHLLVGVEHFYLYNNFSKDAYRDVLAPYIERGVVTLIEWPVEQGQEKAYADCYEKYKDIVQWIAFIDLDEFICSKETIDLKQWLKSFRKYPSVFINWRMFGTGGLMRHDEGKLVTEQYVACWPKLSKNGKSIINTDFIFKTFRAHYFRAEILGRDFLLPVNERRRFVTPWYNRKVSSVNDFQIQINHYWVRSYEHALRRIDRELDALFVYKDIGYDKEVRKADFFNHEVACTDRDYTIQRFLIFLKVRMSENLL